MKYKSIYFTAANYNSQKSSSIIPKSSKYGYNGYNISGELYYYPDLENLIQALKAGKDISARISYTMFSDSDYVGPIYNSGGGSNVQMAGGDTVASIRAGVIYGFMGQLVGIVNQVEKEIGHKLVVIATGGFSKYLEGYIYVNKADVKHTLEGARIACLLNS